MKVIVQRLSKCGKDIYENVTNTYADNGFYCIQMEKMDIILPAANIDIIQEEHEVIEDEEKTKNN